MSFHIFPPKIISGANHLQLPGLELVNTPNPTKLHHTSLKGKSPSSAIMSAPPHQSPKTLFTQILPQIKGIKMLGGLRNWDHTHCQVAVPVGFLPDYVKCMQYLFHPVSTCDISRSKLPKFGPSPAASFIGRGYLVQVSESEPESATMSRQLNWTELATKRDESPPENPKTKKPCKMSCPNITNTKLEKAKVLASYCTPHPPKPRTQRQLSPKA